MKKEFRTIVAIETTINQHTEYISGQSTTFNDKKLPQYNKDVQQAKEFNDEEDANTYLAKVHNPHHRVFNVVAIEIPVLKDKHKRKRRGLAELLYLFIACIVIVSCSKSQTLPPTSRTDHYKLFIEHYTMDTVFITRFIWWQDTLSNPKEKIKIDTLKPKWNRICDSNQQPTHLEYTYYTRNGIKIN